MGELEKAELNSSHNLDSEDLSEMKPEAGKLDKSEAFEAKVAAVSEMFKERLLASRKNLMKTLVFADQLDVRDPQQVAEIATDIFAEMRKQEKLFAV